MTLPCCATTITCLSEVPLSDDCALIFDLDDTISPEREYVRSGFKAIAEQFDNVDNSAVYQRLEALFELGQKDPIGQVLKEFDSSLGKDELLTVYREHPPEIHLPASMCRLLDKLKSEGRRLGLLTDGRSVSQRQKIRALRLEQWITEIVISEEFGSSKPDRRNYQHFERIWPNQSYAYIGDNLAKDFVTPNDLGWTTIALQDRGQNIHAQMPQSHPEVNLPQYFVEKLA